MRTNRVLLMGVVVALSIAGCATVETGPVRDVSGTWIGQCQNCPVRRFTLVIVQNGPELRGTLQASPRTGLGELPMPLLDGKISGRAVSFYTQGGDGVNFNVNLRVSGDGKRMDGHGSHRAGFPLFFTRE
jgi:hypothetical protein